MDTEKILTINGVFDQVESAFGYKNISSDEQLMDWLQGIKVRTGFTDIAPHAPLLAGDTWGLLTIYGLFYENDYDGFYMTKKQALKEYEKKELYCDGADNSYNWGSPIECDFNLETFYCPNDDSELAFISFHTGVDIREGYTNYFLMRFDGKDALCDFLCYTSDLCYVGFTYHGHDYAISLDGSVSSGDTELYATIDYDENAELENKINALQDAGLDMIWDGKKKTLNAILKALGIDKKDIKDLIME